MMHYKSFALLALMLAVVPGFGEEYQQVSITLYDQTLRDAQEALKNGQYDEAFEGYSQGARWGDKESQRMLGILYLSGQGVEVDPVEGYAWLKLAAESGREVDQEYLQRAKEALPGAAVAAGEEVFREYQPVYGMKAMEITCRKRRVEGEGRIMVCERDYSVRDSHYRIPVPEAESGE